MKINIRNMTTWNKAGMDWRRELIIRRILGIFFIDLSGFSTLIVLSAFKFGILGSYSIKLMTTTKKSIQFHPSLK